MPPSRRRDRSAAACRRWFIAELFILEFEGFGEDDYIGVNSILGIDHTDDEGDWPAGMVSHIAAPIVGGWTVIEVWETREHQDEFMKSRLGPALHKAGHNKPPKRAEWSKATAHRSPRKRSAKSSTSA